MSKWYISIYALPQYCGCFSTEFKQTGYVHMPWMGIKNRRWVLNVESVKPATADIKCWKLQSTKVGSTTADSGMWGKSKQTFFSVLFFHLHLLSTPLAGIFFCVIKQNKNSFVNEDGEVSEMERVSEWMRTREGKEEKKVGEDKKSCIFYDYETDLCQ